jgi:hypothetical protein
MNILFILLLAQVGLQSHFRVDFAPYILAGDVIYAKACVVNRTDHAIQFGLDYRIKVGLTWQGIEMVGQVATNDRLGWGTTDPPTVKPNEMGCELVVFAPWLVFQERPFDGVPRLQAIVAADIDRSVRHPESFGILCTNTPMMLKEGEWDILSAEVHGKGLGCNFERYVLDAKPDVHHLYFSRSDTEINDEYGYNGRLGPPHDQARSRGATQYDRMMPVDWHFFEIPLNYYYRVPEHFDKLVTQLNPQSKLYRVCRLVQMANEWVQAPDGEERLRKEQQMLAYAGQRRGGQGGSPSIESEFLTNKVKQLIATKERERGPYVPPGE